MEFIYPPGPTAVPADLTLPTPAYKRHAWFAVAGLMLFVVLYFLLAGWFGWTSYRLLAGSLKGGDNAFWGGVIGVCAAFLAIFMLKALIFVKHGGESQDIEITAKQQPRLFEFLFRLADEAGAPRPHRVFLSPTVNAAVFYDLSLLNLFFPSKKNLLIGLGLVNVLSLGELKAVLAHEFGHFAQRSMAVGRWVYVAQQIAAHIVHKRDALDSFLRGLSRFDFRVAWIGWVLSLIVWSLRSLLETAFQLVVLAQRALSREMEMQADLVAVSLTGSDALIHALHKLQAADEAWERAYGFAHGELTQKRALQDVFAIQTRIIERIGAIRDDPSYGKVPPPPAKQPEGHRLFRADLAHPPRMWATHPFNHERESNAKRVYVPAAIDERSAWELFDDPTAVRARMTAHVLSTKEDTTPLSTEEALQQLNARFERESFKRAYRGAYLGRSVVRDAKTWQELYAGNASVSDLNNLYPESLASDLDHLRNLEQDKAMLEALRDGVFTAPNGIIRHRGKELEERELPHAIDTLRTEITQVRATVSEHDRLCRSAHRAAAAGIGNGWEPYLVGLAQALHYADHTEADLRDGRRFLANTVAVVTAARRVNAKGVERVVSAASVVHALLQRIAREAKDVHLDPSLAARLKVETWPQALEEFALPAPAEGNINEWIKVIDGWVDSYAGALSSLSSAALEQLLESEAHVARDYRQQTAAADTHSIASAPEASTVSVTYPNLVPGAERELQRKLDWWVRFQNADGVGPTIARLVAALGIVGAVLGFGGKVGTAEVTIYNGLARPLKVDFGGHSVSVAPFGSNPLTVDPDHHYVVHAKTIEGQEIESFETDVGGSFSHHVYNVASASALVEWAAIYGNARPQPERLLGAPRWSSTTAEVLFQEPPTSVKTKGGGAIRTVLSGFAEQGPNRQLQMIQNSAEQPALIRAHARWDAAGSRHLMHWLSAASRTSGFAELLRARLQDNSNDIVALRYEYEVPGANQDEVCSRHQKLAQAAPNNGDFQYLISRCNKDAAQRDQAILQAHQKWPNSAWLAYSAGYTMAERQQWEAAAKSLLIAFEKEPVLAELTALDIARIRRVMATDGHADLSDLARNSDVVRWHQTVESGQASPGDVGVAYELLAQGQFEQAQAAAKGIDGTSRLLRLAAASDGAAAELEQQALKLTANENMDPAALWAAIALAARAKADAASYVALLPKRMREEEAQAVLRFLNVLRGGGNASTAEQALGAVGPETRGHAYSVGLVLLGEDAPKTWRTQVKRLLFVTERPYFR